MLIPSFITANYVGRATRYAGPSDWGARERATMAASNLPHFQALADDVQAAGFTSIDIWTAHCHWQRHDVSSNYPEMVREVCRVAGLATSSYAGGIGLKGPADLDAPLALMKRLGTPIFAGGIWGLPNGEIPAIVQDTCTRYNVKWAFENHPEKTIDDILARIGGGKYSRCGVCLDTGWCGIQGIDALEAVQRLAPHLFILHLKDITAPGSHDTCALGEGVVPCEKIVRYLVESGWHGTVSIEHEPYDRDPMSEVKLSLQRVLEWMR